MSESNALDLSGLPPSAQEELCYWDRELTLKGQHPETTARRLDPKRRQQEFPALLTDPLLPLLRSRFGVATVLCFELGPGPLSTLAWGVQTGLLEVTAVDVLADRYRELLASRGITDYPVQPVAGTGESLLEVAEPRSFQLVFVNNALDHTDDAPRVFDNLVELAMIDGAIVLQHHLNEGTHRSWSDSHKWNLHHGAGGLAATDRSGNTYELGQRDDLELVHLNYRSYVLDGWMDVVYRRLDA